RRGRTVSGFTMSFVSSLLLCLFLPRLLRYFQNAAGLDGFIGWPYFSKHRWWAAFSPPPSPPVRPSLSTSAARLRARPHSAFLVTLPRRLP
ncbi:hypothetical protein FQA47_012975, partial [Oryzias melastigma]